MHGSPGLSAAALPAPRVTPSLPCSTICSFRLIDLRYNYLILLVAGEGYHLYRTVIDWSLEHAVKAQSPA